MSDTKKPNPPQPAAPPPANDPTATPVAPELDERLVPLPDSILRQITPAQIAAYETLVRGGTTSSAATAARVSRSTLYGWLQHDQPLARALRQWKLDWIAAARQRAMLLTRDAVVAVAAAIRDGDARIALRLLEGMGVVDSSGVGETYDEARARRTSAQATVEELHRDCQQSLHDLSNDLCPSLGPLFHDTNQRNLKLRAEIEGAADPRVIRDPPTSDPS
jgi:hypothetical protein